MLGVLLAQNMIYICGQCSTSQCVCLYQRNSVHIAMITPEWAATNCVRLSATRVLLCKLNFDMGATVYDLMSARGAL